MEEAPAADLPSGEIEEAPWRTLEYFATTRVFVASALVLGTAALGIKPPGVSGGLQGSVLMALAYFAAAALFAGLALYVHRHFKAQVFCQLTLDLVAVTAMVVASGGAASGWVILYLLPLAGAALLLPPLQVFFVCAVAVIALLTDAALRTIANTGDSMLFQAGIFGAALFAVAALLRALSARLASQEKLARSRGRDLQNQLAINRLVIAQMDEGVIVVDKAGRVRANNRAARAMLGLESSAQLTGERLADIPAAAELAAAFTVWSEGGRSEGLWSNTIVPAAGNGAPQAPEARLRARFARPTAPSSPSTGEFVIFIEDVRDVEDRAQQLKLAAMGRLTASIAHEIRNPLAAISNAGQLLNEDARDPVLKRLAVIVRENTQRLNRLVEDVLRVARREPPLGDEIGLGEFVRQFLDEFCRDRGLATATVAAQLTPDQRVKFEQSHLRQVLYNLVDNALRYASGGPGCVCVVVEPAPDGDRPQLWVLDDGPGVPFEARTALFEPFYTTRNQGTGLGLYLAREFCVTNRAELTYASRREMDGATRDGFLLRFGLGARADASLHGFLDTIPIR